MLWHQVKEQLRQPAHMVGLMRGFLAGSEVAVVIATAPDGDVRPLAVLITAGIADEIVLPRETPNGGWAQGRFGDYPVEIWISGHRPATRPVAVKLPTWMYEHLLLFARRLWTRPVLAGGHQGL